VGFGVKLGCHSGGFIGPRVRFIGGGIIEFVVVLIGVVRLNPVLRFETLLDQLFIAQLPIKRERLLVVESIDFVVGQLARVTAS